MTKMPPRGSQTDEEEHHVELGESCCDASARFEEINVKLDKVFTASGETEVLK